MHGTPQGERERKQRLNERMEEQRHEKGTFLVKIYFRQRESWQGEVTWAEEKKTVSFRSALELIRLLDEAGYSEGRRWEDGTVSSL